MSNEEKDKSPKPIKRPLLHKIVNVFIGFVAFLFFLLIIFFGFSQTKTFRKILKDEIIETVNSSIEGKLNIDNIEGSILSSVILNNTSLVSEGDTLFSANKLTVKTSPIHLLLKRIFIRDIIIKNGHINLTEDKNGQWSFSKLAKSTEDKSKENNSIESDSTSSPFPFTIQINNLQIENSKFIQQTYQNINSKNYYKHFTSDDLQLNNINLKARLFANLNTSTVRMFLDNFSVEPNFKLFNLKKLSGQFEFTEEHAQVQNLQIVTDSTNIQLSAKIDELNLLGNVKLKDLKEYPISLRLEAFPFTFSDLYTFLPDLDFFDDSINMNLRANGYFGNFTVKELNLGILNSIVNIRGKIKNLHRPEKLFFDVEIFDSKIVEQEAYNVIKGLDIPLYKDLALENLNVKFNGEPTKFNAKLDGTIKESSVSIDTYLNLQSEEMEYDTKFRTENLDIFPFLGLSSSLTSSGRIKGLGTDPNSMQANLSIQALNSVVDSIAIDSLNFSSIIKSKLLDVALVSKVNNASLDVKGKLDLRDKNTPFYDLFGRIKNLDLTNFTGNVQDSSDLNIEFVANGKNLTLDDMVGFYELKLQPSYLRNLNLEETSIKLDLLKSEESREIQLVSDFVDFDINGQFSLEKAIDILIYEGVAISDGISAKIEELNPIQNSTKQNYLDTLNTFIPTIAKENLEFSYQFVFKDFDLIALFLSSEALDITGYGEGTVQNDSLNFKLSTDLSIQNLLNKSDDNILYLSNIETNLNFNRNNKGGQMFGSVSIEGEKAYAGIELNAIEADFIFNQNKLFFYSSLAIENEIDTEIEGIATTTIGEERLEFSNININYKNIPWNNFDTCVVQFSDDGVQLSNFLFENGTTIVDINAQINSDRSHNFFLNIEGMPGALFSTYLFNDESQTVGGDYNLHATSYGFLQNPNIDVDINIFGISYDNVNFGSLTGLISHADSNTMFDVDFLSPQKDITSPLLTLDGNLPLQINFLDNKEMLNKDSNLLIALRANDFELGSLGNVLPYIHEQYGEINSRLDIKGNLNKLTTDGYLSLSEAGFTSRNNNLQYGTQLNTTFNKQTALINKVTIYNKGGSKYSGELQGSGEISLKEIPFDKIDLELSGNLALLGKSSQTRNANIYGDLFINSDKNWKFTYLDNQYNFSGDIIVDRADLVYTSQENNKFGQSRNIIYKFIEDSSKININAQNFVKILNETKLAETELLNENASQFNFNTSIIINNIATFNFLLSPDLNQKLSVETTGKIKLEKIGEQTSAQGSLSLLSGSRLEFFKIFDAEGNIRFENDIADPRFDIVATYIGEIENFENLGNTEEVAVKLKLNSKFSEIKENLSGRNKNLSVYVGRTNIKNNIPDTKYDQSNALTFIVLDQLSLNLNDEQKSTLSAMTENAAFSLLGSYIASTLGFVSNIRLNKYSGRDSYKLLFSGKYNNIRYLFGGSFGSQTEYLQLSKADIRVEYLFNPNFLIRLEQKAPIVETLTEEKIQEIGLKYKFEF